MAGMTSSGQAESDSPGTAFKDPPDVRLVDGEAATLEEKVRRLEAQNRELANAALTDPLTGLLNHRASHEQLAVELQRAGREQYPVAVLALDIDFFKGLNDSWVTCGATRSCAGSRNGSRLTSAPVTSAAGSVGTSSS